MNSTQTIDSGAIFERHVVEANRRNRIVRTIVGGVLGGFRGLAIADGLRFVMSAIEAV